MELQVESKPTLVERLKGGLKKHFVDSTAIIAESTPAFMTYELYVANMSQEVSGTTRLLAAGTTYAGLGFIWNWGRQKSRNLCNVTDKSTECIQHVHDGIYTGLFTFVTSPAFYFTAGETDLKKIAIGSVVGGILAGLNGGPLGYVTDAVEDLTGIKESERLPDLIKRQNPTAKKGLAALLLIGSLAATSALYVSKSQSPTPATQPSYVVQR